ncbi:MAG TPA: carboxylesterase family protein [Candidatus Kapabacteria bacterium]|nr:carboxylesterase family protein [Candidatus Kapabacteria bacterium]
MTTAKRSLRALLQPLALVCATGLLTGCPHDIYLKTGLGVLRGTLEDNGKVVSWKGVPYAQAPVGDLRWQAPRPAQPWHGVRDARDFGSACTQIGSMYGPPAQGSVVDINLRDVFDKPVGSEDCLFLNLWRPASKKKNLPVVLFIHGGSHMVGTSSYYRGDRLAQEDMIFISVNYRLNLFGWLNHPALKVADDGSDPLAPLTNSGNFATLDLIQALQFVRNHIDEFGGDPDNVTIMGQSAGASSVFSLLVSPLAQGLFDKAVMLSPGLINQSPETSFNYANGLLVALALQAGLATDADSAAVWLATQTPQQLRAFLYSRTPQQLVTATQLDPRLSLTPAILRDGLVQPADPNAAVASGQFNNVPVLVGLTQEEGKLFTRPAFLITSQERWTLMQTFNPDDPASTPTTLEQIVRPELLPADRPQQGTCGAEDFIVGGYNAYANLCGSPFPTALFRQFQDQALLPLLAMHQPALYAYHWGWNQQPEPWRTVYGAAHGSDVPFLLGLFDTPLFAHGYTQQNAPGRQALSDHALQALAAFAKTGDPNHADLPVAWLPWSPAPGAPKRLLLDADDEHALLDMSAQ